jgi:hypothetical protein
MILAELFGQFQTNPYQQQEQRERNKDEETKKLRELKFESTLP